MPSNGLEPLKLRKTDRSIDFELLIEERKRHQPEFVNRAHRQRGREINARYNTEVLDPV